MFRTWAITFRPRGGVTDNDLKLLDTWSERHPYRLIGIEKEDDARHVHMAIVTRVATSPSAMKTTLLHVLKSGTAHAEKRLDPAEIRTFRKGVKPWYNHDWVDNYIGADRDHKEGDQYTCYRTNLPADLDELNEYYPPKDDKSLVKPCSIKYVKWEKLLLAEHSCIPWEWTDADYERWLLKHMCHDRDIECQPDPRKRKQEAAMLHLFVTHTGQPVTPDTAAKFAL